MFSFLILLKSQSILYFLPRDYVSFQDPWFFRLQLFIVVSLPVLFIYHDRCIDKPDMNLIKSFVKEIHLKKAMVVCKGCGWSWKLSQGGEDPYVCHKCGHDNTLD